MLTTPAGDTQMRYTQMPYLLLLLVFASLMLVAATTDTDPKETEVVFPASGDSIMLAGTVTEPDDRPPVAVAVLLPVAGPTDRDGTLGPHRYFRTLAHALAAQGIVTLRFDDRGVGSSEGNLLETDLNDRAADACQALKTLQEHVDFPEAPLGFIGMSEGGTVGLLAAHRCGPVAFTVLLSTPVRKGMDVIEGQLTRLLEQTPLAEDQRLGVETAARRFLELASDTAAERHRDEIHEILAGPHGRMILPPYQFVPQSSEARTDFVLSSWYQSQLHYDVRQALANAQWSVLALYGDLDQVADPQMNAELVVKLNPAAVVSVLPRLNHLMQEAETGSPLEYARLPNSVSDDVVNRIIDWLREL